MRKENNLNNAGKTPLLPETYEEAIQYISDIREYWRVNQRHCDPTCPEARPNFVKNNITFDPSWLGDNGFVRFYLFLLYNNYIPSKTEIERIDKNKGFSPSNLKVVPIRPQNVPKPKKTPKTKNQAIPAQGKSFANHSETTITNNFVMFSEDLKLKFVKEVFNAMGYQNVIVDEQNSTIVLNLKK